MLDTLKNYALKKAYAIARKKGPTCPSCGGKIELPFQMPKEGMDAESSCVKCGWDGLITDLFRIDRRERVVVDKPADSKIKLGMSADGQTWEIPATKRLNFFWFFSVFWLAITGAGTFAFLFGSVESDGGPVGPWFLLFLVPFWAVGLGVLYVAIRGTFGSTTVIKNNRSIIVRQHLFGRSRDKGLALDNIKRVEMDKAYSQDDEPVYRVEIKAKEGKDLKFGTTLSDDEKSWMVSELSKACKVNNVMLQASANDLNSVSVNEEELVEFSEKGLSVDRLENGSGFKVEVNDKMAKYALLVSVFSLVVGSIFLVSGIGDLADVEFSGGIFGIIVGLFSVVGFIVGCIACLVGIVFLVVAIKIWGTNSIFEFRESELIWNKMKSHEILKTERYARSSFKGVKVKKSGHVNDVPRYEVRLLGAKKKRLCYFVTRETADKLQCWLSHWVHGGDGSSESKRDDLGYGNTIKL